MLLGLLHDRQRALHEHHAAAAAGAVFDAGLAMLLLLPGVTTSVVSGKGASLAADSHIPHHESVTTHPHLQPC